MISRRLLRIKAMQTYYAYLQDSGELSIKTVQDELERNINQSYALYIHLHCLLIAIFDFATDRMEISRNKYVPSASDLNPKTKFIDNRVICAFRAEPKVTAYMNNEGFNWSDNPQFIKSIWNIISNSSYYRDYMSIEESSLKSDVEIVSKIINKSLIDCPQLDDILEDKNIYWNDDLEFSLSNIIQNIKKIKEDKIESYRIPPLYKNIEDEEFPFILIKRAVLSKDKFDKIILDTLKKWELERIAFMDRVLLHLALCEIMEMPNMPVKVTINEYLDISKFYSTDKSNLFINGILDKVYNKLKSEGNLNKTGLGLVE